MVSRSLAMKRSTSSFHSSLGFNWPRSNITSLASIQKTVAIDFGRRLLHGITTSTNSKGASVLHSAMQGMLTYEAQMTAWLSFLGSATTISRGSWNFMVFWLVSVPGIHLEEALAVQCVYCPNLQTALCPCSLAQTTMTSARLGMDAMSLAANLMRRYISSTLKMQFPAAFFSSTNFFMLWLILLAPRCTCIAHTLTLAASRRRISVCSSFDIRHKLLKQQYINLFIFWHCHMYCVLQHFLCVSRMFVLRLAACLVWSNILCRDISVSVTPKGVCNYIIVSPLYQHITISLTALITTY